jgi:probable phosphoglycerate mutase
MTKIYLIRHGEAEGNLYRMWQGHWNGRITPMGYRQIDALAERFRNIRLDALYSSDLRRTVATAGAITKYHDLKLITTPRLREINCGSWEGVPFGNVEYYHPEDMDHFNNDPGKWRIPGAETFEHCRNRILSVLTDIATEHDGETVAVVTHGMAIRTILSYFLGVRSEDIRSLPHGDNTSVSLLDYSGGVFTVEYYNDNSHLSQEISTFAKQTWWRGGSGLDRFNLRDEPLDPRADGRLYTDCYRDAWTASHGSAAGFVSSPYLTSAIEHHRNDPRSVLKVFSGDSFAGILDLDTQRGRNAGYGWVTLIYLRPEFRGKNLGIQLLGRAVCLYENCGRNAIRLHVSSDNKNGIAFYEKNGFKIINVEGGVISDLLLMEKELD